MEIEIRARINNLDNFLVALNKLPGIKTKKMSARQVDTYLKHSLDKERKIIFRIRRKANKAIFTLKTKSQHDKKDVAWKDIDIQFDEPDRLEDILLNSGYEYVVLIDKVRDSFQYQKYEINIDNIRDLGYFVEIECMCDQNKSKVIDSEIVSMREILLSLGCENDDIIERGYVQLMEEKVNK